MSLKTKNNNLQETFLSNLKDIKTTVTIFLINGIRLQGVITEFDNFALLLERENQYQLVYKHAIATIMPLDYLKPFARKKVKDEEDDDEDIISF